MLLPFHFCYLYNMRHRCGVWSWPCHTSGYSRKISYRHNVYNTGKLLTIYQETRRNHPQVLNLQLFCGKKERSQEIILYFLHIFLGFLLLTNLCLTNAVMVRMLCANFTRSLRCFTQIIKQIRWNTDISAVSFVTLSSIQNKVAISFWFFRQNQLKSHANVTPFLFNTPTCCLEAYRGGGCW